MDWPGLWDMLTPSLPPAVPLSLSPSLSTCITAYVPAQPPDPQPAALLPYLGAACLKTLTPDSPSSAFSGTHFNTSLLFISLH